MNEKVDLAYIELFGSRNLKKFVLLSGIKLMYHYSGFVKYQILISNLVRNFDTA